MERLYSFVGASIFFGIYLIGIITYVTHLAYTAVNISSVEHTGYAFYMVMGIMFPPLGVFNGMLLWLV